MKTVHCYGRRSNSPEAIYIGRPSIYGNPFVLTKEEDRDAVLERYHDWFYEKVESDPEFRNRILELRGHDLACWCAPRKCHGDVIIEWLETVCVDSDTKSMGMESKDG